ncbi:MAG: hypothetical protein MUC96_37690 [Myxococcaceae bacterium]|jgi:hypothetical protein|nr:hypothetical protein [Myxococcaceae bacterium]
MPHHESGLVALRTTEPKVIDAVAKHFLDQAPHPCIELVRADKGKGVWMCFGSFVGTDVSAFLDAQRNAKLAKALKQPLWVGHAVGGYSNLQTAMAFSASGKRLWSSTFDFQFPPEMAREAEDPFSGPERRHELIKELRASSGYGLIATEFDLDYFRVLSVDAGDALFARDKRKLGPKGAKEHAKWLTSKFRPPEGEPGDGAAPPSPADQVGYRFLGKVDLKELAGLIAHLAAHRQVAEDGLALRAKATRDDCVLVLDGAGVRPLSTTLVSERFVALVGEVCRVPLFAYAWDTGEQPAPRAGQSRSAGLMQFMRAQREPLALTGRFAPVPLLVSPAAAKKFERLRKAMAVSED